MEIGTKEKTRTLCGSGAASCRIVYPWAEERGLISEFYEELSGNMLEAFLKDGSLWREELSLLSRKERMGAPAIAVNHRFAVTLNKDGVVSIARYFAVTRGKALLLCREYGEVWDWEKQRLLPPSRFFSGRALRLAKKNEFYLDGEWGVIAENLHPQGGAQSPSEFVRRTRIKL